MSKEFIYPDLKLYKFKVMYSILDKMILPKFNKGNIIRGAFGETLRRLVCTGYKPKCSLCSELKSCVYTKVFSPIVPDNAVNLKMNNDIPRGFIINAPTDIKTEYEINDNLEFNLVLIDKMINYLPYIILTLNEIGKNGIGKLRSRMTLLNLIQENPFTKENKSILENNTIKPSNISFNINDSVIYYNKSLKVDFLTPARIINNKQVERVPEFSSFIKRLRDRYFALNLFYSDNYKETDFDHILFGEKASLIKIKNVESRFIEQYRKARSQNYRTQDISGFIGKVIYEGDLSDYLPLIMIGQYIGVGKGTTFGFGKYEVVKD